MSDEYVMDKATVFHSTFLTACRLRQSTKSVPIGHYILPPGSVQKGELSYIKEHQVLIKEIASLQN